MMPFWVSVAGGVGAISRFVADGYLRVLFGRRFPWSTLLINVGGSFVLGVVTGALLYRHASNDIRLLVGTGFCGGFTTFSTASFETVRLLEERRFFAAVGQLGGNVLFSVGAAALGLALMR